MLTIRKRLRVITHARSKKSISSYPTGTNVTVYKIQASPIVQAGTSGAVVDVSFTTYAVETAHAQTFVRIDIVKTGSTIQAKTYRRERCKTGIKLIAISLKFSNLWKTSAPCRPIDSYRKKNHSFRWGHGERPWST